MLPVKESSQLEAWLEGGKRWVGGGLWKENSWGRGNGVELSGVAHAQPNQSQATPPPPTRKRSKLAPPQKKSLCKGGGGVGRGRFLPLLDAAKERLTSGGGGGEAQESESMAGGGSSAEPSRYRQRRRRGLLEWEGGAGLSYCPAHLPGEGGARGAVSHSAPAPTLWHAGTRSLKLLRLVRTRSEACRMLQSSLFGEVGVAAPEPPMGGGR